MSSNTGGNRNQFDPFALRNMLNAGKGRRLKLRAGNQPPVAPVAFKKLTDHERTRLRVTGGCFRCREWGHFARYCPLQYGPVPVPEKLAPKRLALERRSPLEPFPFFSLPSELRLRVYQCLFGESVVEFHRGHVIPHNPDAPAVWRHTMLRQPSVLSTSDYALHRSKKAILLSCCQISAEALPVMYDQTIFNFRFNSSPSHDFLHQFWEESSVGIDEIVAVHAIKKINMHMYHCYCQPVPKPPRYIANRVKEVLAAMSQHGVRELGLMFEPNFAIPRAQEAVTQALDILDPGSTILIRVQSGNHTTEPPGGDAEKYVRPMVDELRQKGHFVDSLYTKNYYLAFEDRIREAYFRSLPFRRPRFA